MVDHPELGAATCSIVICSLAWVRPRPGGYQIHMASIAIQQSQKTISINCKSHY